MSSIIIRWVPKCKKTGKWISKTKNPRLGARVIKLRGGSTVMRNSYDSFSAKLSKTKKAIMVEKGLFIGLVGKLFENIEAG